MTYQILRVLIDRPLFWLGMIMPVIIAHGFESIVPDAIVAESRGAVILESLSWSHIVGTLVLGFLCYGYGMRIWCSLEEFYLAQRVDYLRAHIAATLAAAVVMATQTSILICVGLFRIILVGEAGPSISWLWICGMAAVIPCGITLFQGIACVRKVLRYDWLELATALVIIASSAMLNDLQKVLGRSGISTVMADIVTMPLIDLGWLMRLVVATSHGNDGINSSVLMMANLGFWIQTIALAIVVWLLPISRDYQEKRAKIHISSGSRE